jgi:hypothetical protein
LAVRTLARVEARLAQAGVDDHELLSGIDDDGIVGGDKNIRLQVRRRERGIDVPRLALATMLSGNLKRFTPSVTTVISKLPTL